MSATQYVKFGENGFWAVHDSLGVFLKFLIDAAETSNKTNTTWLSKAILDWRTTACVSDYGLTLDSNWSETDRKDLIELIENACAMLANSNSLASEDVNSWQMLDKLSVGIPVKRAMPTKPIIELGHAIAALVADKLPPAPNGDWWLYGVLDGPNPQIIQKRKL